MIALNLVAMLSVAALLVIDPAPAVAAADPIYKCHSPSGAVQYRGVPCPGGERLNFDLAPADPHASERLERDRAELAAGAASRRAAGLRAAVAREAEARRRFEDALVQQALSRDGSQAEGDAYVWPLAATVVARRGAGSRSASRAVFARRASRPLRLPPPVHRPHIR